MAFRHLTAKARPPRREDTAADDLVHRHESHIVPVSRIARPGIAEADQQEHVLARPAYFFAGAGGLPPAAGALPPAAGAAGAAAPAAGAAAPAGGPPTGPPPGPPCPAAPTPLPRAGAWASA